MIHDCQRSPRIPRRNLVPRDDVQSLDSPPPPLPSVTLLRRHLYIYIIYTPNLGLEIAILGREREQGGFRGSSEGTRESNEGAGGSTEGVEGSNERVRESTVR